MKKINTIVERYWGLIILILVLTLLIALSIGFILYDHDGWNKAYVISNWVIALFAVVAVLQYLYTKEDSKKKIEREEALLSFEMIRNFNKEVISTYDEIFDMLEPEFSRLDLKMVRSRDEFTSDEKVFEEIISFKEGVADKINDLLNELVTFAIPIINDLVNEKILFNTLGKFYCELVENFSSRMLNLHSLDDEWKELIFLYDKWSLKIRSQNRKINTTLKL